MDFLDKPITPALVLTLTTLGLNLISKWVSALPKLHGEERLMAIIDADFQNLGWLIDRVFPGAPAQRRDDPTLGLSKFSSMFVVFLLGNSMLSTVAAFSVLRMGEFAFVRASMIPLGPFVAIAFMLPTVGLYALLKAWATRHGVNGGIVRFTLLLDCFALALATVSAVAFAKAI